MLSPVSRAEELAGGLAADSLSWAGELAGAKTPGSLSWAE
jgi:hypothetical protein